MSSSLLSSSSKNVFRYWNGTSTSVLPPFFRCSSTVSCPPENALPIFFFTCFGVSDRKITPSPDDDIFEPPCNDGTNLACNAAGLIRLMSFCVATSLVNLIKGSWSIPTGTTVMCFSVWNCGKRMCAACIAGKKDHPIFWSGFSPNAAFAVEYVILFAIWAAYL